MTEADHIQLLWSGEWLLWQALTAGLSLVVLVWWIYRREIRKGTSGHLRWVLPVLRSLAIIGLALTLAGPVLRLQKEEGNRGRITVFLDSSESMDLTDKALGPGRKILLAREHGFLPEGSNLVDFRIHQASRELKVLAQLLREQESSGLTNQNPKQIREIIFSVIKSLEGTVSKIKEPTKENFLLEEVWFNLNGDNWKDFTETERYKNGQPDQSFYLTKSETKRNTGELFGRRIRAFLQAPMDGEYKFWVYSDDTSVLRIAQPGTENFKKIAEVNSYTSLSWDASIASVPISLKKGFVYPIEMIHKEGTGDDFCAFGWTLPDGTLERPISGERFSAPLAINKSSSTLSMRDRVRQKFTDLLNPRVAKEKIDYERLATEALEISLLMEEDFSQYAQSLLDQNIATLNEAVANLEQFSRIERATRLLNHPTSGFLEEFKDTHILEIRNLSENATDVIWDNLSEVDDFKPDISPESPYTDLSKGILDTLRVETEKEDPADSENIRSAAVLITDGGHNYGGSPLQTAKLLSVRNLPIYTVGLGNDKRPQDFALLQAITPDSVYQEDRVQGILAFKDNLLPGTPYKITVHDSLGQSVWEKSLVGVAGGVDQLTFDFPTKEIVERQLAEVPESQREALRTVPLDFTVSVDPIEGEAEAQNNQVTFSIDANLRKNQLLILDSRPRWETRYLNNLFDRDERWEVVCVWGKPKDSKRSLPRGDEPGEFPTQRKNLFEFDLIIYGEIPPDEFSREEQGWFFDFVSQRGGGILFIDGPRQKLRTYENFEKHPVFSLFPVGWIEKGPVRLSPSAYFRTEASKRLSALTLDPIKERNEEVWNHLPLPAWTSPVNALPGSEIFLEVSLQGKDSNDSQESRIPVLAGKRVGAGKSFYLGFDESWRWRYEVADLYHQRFWNQLTSRVMEQPFALNQEYLSMDVGGTAHALGKGIPIRVRLRDKEGKVPEPPFPEVDALIWKEDVVVATIPMQAKESSNGLFSGEAFGLEASSYQMSIRAPALLDEMEFSEQRLPFEVKGGQNKERNFLICDENLLREMAETSGGNFLREENFHELKEVLRPISSGRIVITEITLWQTFGWLGFIVSLLAMEMFLRKRAGML